MNLNQLTTGAARFIGFSKMFLSIKHRGDMHMGGFLKWGIPKSPWASSLNDLILEDLGYPFFEKGLCI